jgi:transposase-like protein
MTRCPNCGNLNLFYYPSTDKKTQHYQCSSCMCEFSTSLQGEITIINKGKEIFLG